MKKLDEKRGFVAANAWGRDQYVEVQHFEVEEVDVGVTKHNYGGHNRPGYTFTRSDVGRRIAQYTDHSTWNCWGFALQGEKP